MTSRSQSPSTDASTAGSDTDIEQDTQTTPTNTPREPVEVGGPKGLEPTRYGDWERNGRCSDF